MNTKHHRSVCHLSDLQYVFMVLTVRGMMYYREALKLQAFLDMAEDEGLQSGKFKLLVFVDFSLN